MAKPSSRPLRRSGRVVPYNASGSPRRDSAPPWALPRPVSPAADPRTWSEPDPVILPVDRRLYDPAPAFARPAKRFSGRPARVVAPPPIKAFQARSRQSSAPSRRPQFVNPSRLLFQAPQNVVVCVQRGVRKEVLHAKGVAGKSGLAKPKRGPYSSIRCRR